MRPGKDWFVFLGVAAVALVLLALGGLLAHDPHVPNVPAWPKPGTRAWHDLERLNQARIEAERPTPYLMDWSLRNQIATERPLYFRVVVLRDKVEFRESIPQQLPPAGAWFVYVTVEYRQPEGPADPAWRPHIDDTDPEPLEIERGARPSEDELVLKSVAFPDGNHLRFNCAGANYLDAFRKATTAAQVAQVEWQGLCLAFMSLRPGVTLMVLFPINKADVAHVGVTRAIALMDQSIVGQEVEGH